LGSSNRSREVNSYSGLSGVRLFPELP